MAHAARSNDEIPRPPLARPNLGLVAWALFGVLVAAFLAYGFVHSRAPMLRFNSPGITLDGTPGSIHTYGSIPELLDGKLGPKVSLSSLPTGPGVVGIGSLSELRGEIAIVRGVTWLSYAEPGNHTTVERSPTSPESAAFLALADVPHWRTERLDAPIPFDRLPSELEQRAARAGLDASRPFPVLIDGTFSGIELDVANGPALGAAKPTEERLHDTAVKFSSPSGAGSIVGFVAANEGERIVHAGQSMHLHIVLPAEKQVGHLDSATIEAGSTLSLPVPR
ncbi:MAG TPA: acetolactate decarboxylase [Polyangiaceae bacterium]|nr:acetolactate decarboxylase [Polyangiaceae bacterium]